MINKTIEEVLLQKVNSFKEKVTLEESKAYWDERNQLHYIIEEDIENIEFYFLPFKIKVIDLTYYTNQFSFYFNGNRYTVKI